MSPRRELLPLPKENLRRRGKGGNLSGRGEKTQEKTRAEKEKKPKKRPYKRVKSAATKLEAAKTFIFTLGGSTMKNTFDQGSQDLLPDSPQDFSPRNLPPERSLVVGKVLTTHGVQGQLKIQSMMQNPSDLGKIRPFFIQDRVFTQWELFKSMGKPGVFLGRLPGVSTMEEAAILRHGLITIHRSQLPPCEGEIYHVDLLHKSVVDRDGLPLGSVFHVHDFGAGPVLELEPSGLMVSFYAIEEAEAEVLRLKMPLSALV